MNGAKIAYSLFKCTIYILLGDITHKFCFVNIFAVLTFDPVAVQCGFRVDPA